MSSRRGAGEDNILAMLERDSARRMGPRMSGMRLASYGAAAALAGILVGGVAWLAYDNHTSSQELQAAHDASTLEVVPTMPDAVATPQAPPAVAAAHPVEAPHPAVIVDESARKRELAVASAGPVPPLVMLPPDEAKGSRPPAAARPVQDKPEPKPAAAARPEPVRTAARTDKKADKSTKPASRMAKPAKPAKAVQTRHVGPVKATAKTDSPAQSRKSPPVADGPVDSDVALISAIIQHSEHHRGELACTGPRCPSKPARP